MEHTKMKTSDLIYERIKVQPVTNTDIDKAQEEYERNKNPFRLLAADIVGDIKGFPMGVVVRMMEEQKAQQGSADITKFQKCLIGGFDWSRTSDNHEFWSAIIFNDDYEKFFKKYPEYRKYNLD